MQKLRLIVLAGCLLPLASCSNEKKTPPAETAAPATSPYKSTDVVDSNVSVTPGVAGGVIDETIHASATVTALNPDKRTITLKTDDGEVATFIAPPEVRNYDQIHVGDKVKATVISHLTVFVTEGTDSYTAHHTAVARAPKGARPGAIFAAAFELVAKVTKLDRETRRATLEFAGGETRVITVRDDVDLRRYKVGDSLVIRVSQQLTLLVD